MKKDDEGLISSNRAAAQSSGTEDDKLMTIPQVAAFMGWSRGTTYHKLKELPGVVHLSARCVRVWRSSLVDYARARTRN